MDSGGGGCCRCCFSFIFTLGLTALFMWLSLRASKPKCSVQLFYIPTLNETLGTTTNTTVFMTLRLDNGNKDKGVNYDAVNLTLSYFPNATDRQNKVRIGESAIIPQFYQGHKKKATKPANFSAAAKFNWSEIRDRVFKNHSDTAVFRVDLVTAVRFKIMAWRTKRHGIAVGADVPVNHLGVKVNKKGEFDKKGIKLSGGNRNGGLGLGFGGLAGLATWVVLIGAW